MKRAGSLSPREGLEDRAADRRLSQTTGNAAVTTEFTVDGWVSRWNTTLASSSAHASRSVGDGATALSVLVRTSW